MVDIYKVLVIGKSPLDTPLKHKNLSYLENSYLRQNSSNKLSQLYRNSQVVPALKALGYSDLAIKVPVDGFVATLYSKEQ